ncbi:MAG: DUF3793 family protein [Eubacterium sp.]|jgi:hypothetical protein|nr:DUF3793 family protein [Eubacterium sp.]MCI2196532.1 DUF3793 family protein [Eubacterium sp.]
MSEETILMHCSPVITGLKTANLFNYRFEDRNEVLKELKRLNHDLSGKGIRVIPLSFKKNRVLIYVYRPDYLRHDLSSVKARDILSRCGYCVLAEVKDPVNASLVQLMKRLSVQDEFPHEIGLFLGYPVEDVEGFILNQGRNYKCCGFWKVYGNEETAKEKFQTFAACRSCCLASCRRGMTLKQLAVNGIRNEHHQPGH